MIASLRKTDRPRFSYVPFPCYVSQSYFVIKPSEIDLKYLVGLLNSAVSHFWLDKRGKKQGDSLQIDKAPILRIPLRNEVSRGLKERMVRAVDRMLELVQFLHSSEVRPDSEVERVEREVGLAEREVDTTAFEIYELDGDERALIISSIYGN